MSERDYWDEESLEEYRKNLIRQRNELNHITNRQHIKILDEMIERLPKQYPQVKTNKQTHCSTENPKESCKEKLSRRIRDWWIHDSWKAFKFFVGFVTIGWAVYIACIISDANIGFWGELFIKSWSIVLGLIWLGSTIGSK